MRRYRRARPAAMAPSTRNPDRAARRGQTGVIPGDLVDRHAVIAERLGAQLLSTASAGSPEAVVQRLLAVQAQDPRGARLSVRSRSHGLRASDVDDALTDRRSLLVTWLNRGTLHLVTAEDYWWLHPLTTPQLVTGNRRRLAQEGVSPVLAERGVAVIADAVASHGPQTRSQLRHRLSAAGVPTVGQALVHVLLAASLQGQVVRGPMAGTEQAYVAVRDWLGHPPEPLDRQEALGHLARRYLAGHGPAAPADLARWSGVGLGDARRGFDAIGSELAPGRDGLVDLADRGSVPTLPPPRLLGAFDPLLLGWQSRQPFVGKHNVVTSNGIFRPFALVDGRVVGTWGLRDSVLTVHLLEEVPASAVDLLGRDAVQVLEYLGRAPDATKVTFIA